MTSRDFFSEAFSAAEQTHDFWVERLKLEFSVMLNDIMERRGITKAELARRLGVSKPYVSKVLGGNANLTLETMVKLARAVDGRVSLGLSEGVAEGSLSNAFSPTADQEVHRKARRA